MNSHLLLASLIPIFVYKILIFLLLVLLSIISEIYLIQYFYVFGVLGELYISVYIQTATLAGNSLNINLAFFNETNTTIFGAIYLQKMLYILHIIVFKISSRRISYFF